MKIVLSGLHNTGKTTVLNKLKRHGWHIYEELARKNLELLENGYILDFEKLYTIDKYTQLLNVKEDNYKKIAIDRCLFDAYLYTEYYSRKNMIKEGWFNEISWLKKFLKENLNPKKILGKDTIRYICTKPIKKTKIDFLNDYELFNEILQEMQEEGLLEDAIIISNFKEYKLPFLNKSYSTYSPVAS